MPGRAITAVGGEPPADSPCRPVRRGFRVPAAKAYCTAAAHVCRLTADTTRFAACRAFHGRPPSAGGFEFGQRRGGRAPRRAAGTGWPLRVRFTAIATNCVAFPPRGSMMTGDSLLAGGGTAVTPNGFCRASARPGSFGNPAGPGVPDGPGGRSGRLCQRRPQPS